MNVEIVIIAVKQYHILIGADISKQKAIKIMK